MSETAQLTIDIGRVYLEPTDRQLLRWYLGRGFRVLRTDPDHFGPGGHALVLVREGD